MNWSSIFGGIASVLRALVSSSALPPDQKTTLHSTLDNVEAAAAAPKNVAGAVATTVAEDAAAIDPSLATTAENVADNAPAEAAGLVETGEGALLSAVGGPVGAALAPEAEAITGGVVEGLVEKFEGIFAKHNAALVSDLKAAAAEASGNTTAG